MGERVDWSELPQELLFVIGKYLKSSIDVLRFRSICKLWRSSVPPSYAPFASLPRSITTPYGQNCLTQSTIYRLEPIHSTQNSDTNLSSSEGSLIKVDESKYGHLYLYPFKSINFSSACKGYTPDPFPKPKMLNLLNFRFVELFKGYSFINGGSFSGIVSFRENAKVVLFPNFSWREVENCMVFFVYGQGKLGFSKVGEDNWTLLDEKNFEYDDIIVHKGQLYVVDRSGTISWIDCSSLKLVQFAPPLCLFRYDRKKHLMESDGSMYVVDMYIIKAKVVDLKVYKLDEEWGRWLDVKNLGEHVFVLAKDYNFSLVAQDFQGCERNCIYLCVRGEVSVFSLESFTFKSPKISWHCPSLCGLGADFELDHIAELENLFPGLFCL